MFLHGAGEPLNTVELARAFDKTLTNKGVDHTYVEVKGDSGCGRYWAPILQFMSEHLDQ